MNHGLLTYPVLQAADIVIYKASLRAGGQGPGRAPRAGREIVRAFNNRYGDTFPEPQAVFTSARRPGHRRREEDVEVGGNTIDILGDAGP